MFNSKYMERTFSNSRSTIKGSRHAGFTLIETIVAIAVLVMAVGGPLTLAARTLRVAQDAKNEFIASQMAVEGMEVIHNMRDNNSADDTSSDAGAWMSNPPINIFQNCIEGCIVDVTRNSSANTWSGFTITACPSGDCTNMGKMFVNDGSGIFRQSSATLGSGWTFTGFRRWIEIEGIDDSGDPEREVKVTTYVSYQSVTGATRTLTLTEHLLNWFPPL